MSYSHAPVLLQEVLFYLNPQPGQNFIDATLGGGGYSLALLEKINNQNDAGQVLSIDLDPAAIENYQDQLQGKVFAKHTLVAQGNFKDLDTILERNQFQEFNNISGIVADLGLSSYQLDQSGRGITFQKNELLDMRFNPSHTTDAKFILNNYSLDELTRMFRQNGEEPSSYSIAKAVLVMRETSRMYTTGQLVEAIQQGLPKPRKHLWQNAARRIFQAVRMEVNQELDNLRIFLPKAFDLLAPGGRLVVVSFHSLEDRIVKQFFVQAAKGCICPPEFPYCKCGKTPQGQILTKRPVTATQLEQSHNSRSRPAKLRAILKLH